MATIADYREKVATMTREEFLAHHTRRFLVAMGRTAGAPVARNEEDEEITAVYEHNLKAHLGTHPLAGHVYELGVTGGTCRIGRSESNDVRILDEAISSEHCVLHFGPDGAQIEDLGSTNGTYVTGVRCVPGKRFPIEDDDVITFGRYNFAYLSPKAFHLAMMRLA
jgi:hypothetical protein